MMSFITSRETKVNEILRGYNLVSADQITAKLFLKSRSCLFAMIATGIGMYVCTYFASFLAVRMKTIYGVSDEKMGLYMACISGPYMIGAILTPILFENVPRKL